MRRRKIILTKDDEQHVFNNRKEAGDYLGVSRERVRQILSEENKIHKKTGYAISVGDYVPRKKIIESEFETFYKKALYEEIIKYKDKIFKHYKNGTFVAKDSSYIRLIKQTESIKYVKNNNEKQAKIGNEYTYRVVAKMYLPNPRNCKEVGHINGLENGHGVKNLYWHSTNERKYKERKKYTNKYSYKILGVDKFFNSQQDIANYLGVSRFLIERIVNKNHYSIKLKEIKIIKIIK